MLPLLGTFKMFWLNSKFFGIPVLQLFQLCDLSQSRSCWFQICLLTSLSRAVGNVVCGRPVKYWSMGSCAGASRDMRSTCLNIHERNSY